MPESATAREVDVIEPLLITQMRKLVGNGTIKVSPDQLPAFGTWIRTFMEEVDRWMNAVAASAYQRGASQSVIDEQERCAQVAEREFASEEWHSAAANAGIAIAKAIRAYKKTPRATAAV